MIVNMLNLTKMIHFAHYLTELQNAPLEGVRTKDFVSWCEYDCVQYNNTPAAV